MVRSLSEIVEQNLGPEVMLKLTTLKPGIGFGASTLFQAIRLTALKIRPWRWLQKLGMDDGGSILAEVRFGML